MTTRIGFDHYTIAHRGVSPPRPWTSPASTASTACSSSTRPRSTAPSTRPPSPASAAAPTRRGFTWRSASRRPTRSGGRARRAARSRPPSTPQFLARHVAGVAALGCGHARLYVGDRHDRFRRDTPWAEQVDAARDVLARLTPVLRDHAVKVAIETHADLTVDELLGLLDRLDPEVAGVTLDTGNLIMRLDDPVRAAERLAPRVLEHARQGLRRRGHAAGALLAGPPGRLGGAADARPARPAAPRQPVAQPDASSFTPGPTTCRPAIPSWLAYFPALHSDSLPRSTRLAELCEERYASGFLERPEAVEAVPWADRDLDWLALSLGYLRRVVPALVRVDPPRDAGLEPCLK